jgi:hypothetical protein
MRFYCGVKNHDVEVNPDGICLDADSKCPACSRKLEEL